jgi:ribose 5-phosphate isomerase A
MRLYERIAGRSAAWLARLPWEQEVTSSNLVAPSVGRGVASFRSSSSRAAVPVESSMHPPTLAGPCAVEEGFDSPKARAALAAAGLVQDGMIAGLGSGTTAALIVRRLAERVVGERLDMVGVATSVATATLARELKIPLRELDDVAAVDINLDGADEIDPQFRMIKGRGGALLREKIIVTAARRRVTVITDDKRVDRLGKSVPIPVEVSPIGVKHTERLLQLLGATTAIRRRPDGSAYLTDGGNEIIDCQFAAIADPSALDQELQCVAGVLETGFFIDLCDTLIVGSAMGVEQIESNVRALRPSR